MFWVLGILTILVPAAALLLCWRGGRSNLAAPANMAPYWGSAAALSALLAVMADAFLAHGSVLPALFSVAETASRYQLVHGLALVSVALVAGLQRTNAEMAIAAAGWCFAFGIAFFSGILYLRAAGLTALTGLAPLGGTLLMLGWIALALALWRRLR